MSYHMPVFEVVFLLGVTFVGFAVLAALCEAIWKRRK